MMLSGIKTQVDSLFPTLSGLVPDEEELNAGAEKLKFGRVVEISGYHTEIFDMHDPAARKSYNELMLKLSKSAQIGTVRILVHDRQIMQRGDGSNGWFGYLEWMEYDRTESSKQG